MLTYVCAIVCSLPQACDIGKIVPGDHLLLLSMPWVVWCKVISPEVLQWCDRHVFLILMTLIYTNIGW